MRFILLTCPPQPSLENTFKTCLAELLSLFGKFWKADLSSTTQNCTLGLLLLKQKKMPCIVAKPTVRNDDVTFLDGQGFYVYVYK